MHPEYLWKNGSPGIFAMTLVSQTHLQNNMMEAIASGLEAIASRLEAIATRVEVQNGLGSDPFHMALSTHLSATCCCQA